MLSQQEREKPLVLRRRSEILMAKMALNDMFDPGYHRAEELSDVVRKSDQGEEAALVYRGAAKAVILYALHEVVIAPPRIPEDPTAHELWQQAQAAAILGEHFASLMVPMLTAKMIATGLINHDPDIDGPISASIPVLVAA